MTNHQPTSNEIYKWATIVIAAAALLVSLGSAVNNNRNHDVDFNNDIATQLGKLNQAFDDIGKRVDRIEQKVDNVQNNQKIQMNQRMPRPSVRLGRGPLQKDANIDKPISSNHDNYTARNFDAFNVIPAH